jgi:hypothetical protein
MGFESEFKFFKKEFKTVKFWSRPIIHDQFYTEYLPILGGQKAAVSDSVEGWCAAGNIVQTNGQRDDRDGWRDGRVQGRLHLSSQRLLLYITSVGPVHNAQVCYIPRRAPAPGPSHFPLRFFTPLTPPLPPVLPIFHFGSLPCRPGHSHFPLRFFNLSIPPAGPWHFPLRFCNPLIPPAGPWHFPLRFFNPSIPPAGPSHFPLRLFNPSIPPTGAYGYYKKI